MVTFFHGAGNGKSHSSRLAGLSRTPSGFRGPSTDYENSRFHPFPVRFLGLYTKTKKHHDERDAFLFGAGNGNRTRISTLEGSHNSHYTMPAKC